MNAIVKHIVKSPLTLLSDLRKAIAKNKMNLLSLSSN